MKNYKTTIVALLGAIWLAVQPIISNGSFSWSTDWKGLLGAVMVAAFGFVAKDFNVTGGNVLNDPNSSAVATEATKKDQPAQ